MPSLPRLHKELIMIQSIVKTTKKQRKGVNILLPVRKIKPNLISSWEILVFSCSLKTRNKPFLRDLKGEAAPSTTYIK